MPAGEGTFDREDQRKSMQFAFRNAGVDCITVGYKSPATFDEAIENLNLVLAWALPTDYAAAILAERTRRNTRPRTIRSSPANSPLRVSRMTASAHASTRFLFTIR